MCVVGYRKRGNSTKCVRGRGCIGIFVHLLLLSNGFSLTKGEGRTKLQNIKL